MAKRPEQPKRKPFSIFAPEVKREYKNRNNHRVSDHVENFTFTSDPWDSSNTIRPESRDLREYFHESVGYGRGLDGEPSWFDGAAFYFKAPRRDGPHVLLPRGYEAYFNGNNKYIVVSEHGHVGIWYIRRNKNPVNGSNDAINLIVAFEGNEEVER